MNSEVVCRAQRWIRIALAGLVVTLAGCGGGAETPDLTSAPPPADPVVMGAQLMRSLGDIALVGETYRSSVAVVPNDRRNSVTALAVTNTTAGGAIRCSMPPAQRPGLLTMPTSTPHAR